MCCCTCGPNETNGETSVKGSIGGHDYASSTLGELRPGTWAVRRKVSPRFRRIRSRSAAVRRPHSTTTSEKRLRDGWKSAIATVTLCVVRTPILETRRLLLRPLTLADSHAIQAIFPNWEIVKFLLSAVPWPYPEDGALEYIRDVALPAVQRGEEWAWTIRLRSKPDTIIGSISLFTKDDENRGYWLALDYQRAGLMFEACEATNRFWFETLGRTVLRELKAAANFASVRLSKHQQMTLVWEGEREFVSGRIPAQIWELTARDWRVETQKRFARQ